jgi:hypothetical protein
VNELVRLSSFGKKDKVLSVAGKQIRFGEQAVRKEDITGILYWISPIQFYEFSVGTQYRIGLKTLADQLNITLSSYFGLGHDYFQDLCRRMGAGNRPDLQNQQGTVAGRRNPAITAQLDWLSRNAAFIFTLRDSGVDFVCADMPEVNTLTIGIFAILAQHDRKLNSSRTRAALQQKKIQGFAQGKPENLTERARLKGLRVRQENACSHKDNRQATGLIVMYRGKGMNYQIIAERLKSHDFTTR